MKAKNAREGVRVIVKDTAPDSLHQGAHGTIHSVWTEDGNDVWPVEVLLDAIPGATYFYAYSELKLESK